MSSTASSLRLSPDRPFPLVFFPSIAPLPQFCPKLACMLTPSLLSFVALVLTRPVRILLISLAVSPAYTRMSEKGLQREKEPLENCELDSLSQKTTPHQQCSIQVTGKMTDVPVLGSLRAQWKDCTPSFCTAMEKPLWVWKLGFHIPLNRSN